MYVSILAWLRCIHCYQWNSQRVEIPDYIIEHAPLVYLYSEERYVPGSIEQYIPHFFMSTNSHNFTSKELTIANLNSVARESRFAVGDPDAELFMSSKYEWEPEPGPEWLTGFQKHKPNILTGKIEEAMATLIVVDKPHINAVDAFWFYFYPFNLGPFVMGHGPFGNHIGDWEHSLVRFNRRSHKPEVLWMSAHGGGTAYEWESLLDHDVVGGSRPVIFSARGTHAQYSSPGRHPHDIPFHMLSDYTDRGDLWDPSLNYIAYTLNGNQVHPGNGSVPGREDEFGDWLLYDGHWGNKQLDKRDPRQQWSPFEFKLIDGPTGPLFKNLQRSGPCQRSKWWNFAKTCRIRHRATAGEGFDSDISDCEVLLAKFPNWLRPLVDIVTKNGYLCFYLDRWFA